MAGLVQPLQAAEITAIMVAIVVDLATSHMDGGSHHRVGSPADYRQAVVFLQAKHRSLMPYVPAPLHAPSSTGWQRTQGCAHGARGAQRAADAPQGQVGVGQRSLSQAGLCAGCGVAGKGDKVGLAVRSGGTEVTLQWLGHESGTKHTLLTGRLAAPNTIKDRTCLHLRCALRLAPLCSSRFLLLLQVRRKEALEAELTQIEADIKCLSRGDVILVVAG